jgi:energy-coupling factor transporter ATP-binding protein EcfA2
MNSHQRPVVTELRLSAFKSHRGAAFPLGPITLLAGASGTGKSSVLEGLAVLGRLASGADLQEVFAVPRSGRSLVRGGAAACVPQDAPPDPQGRRGFRIGCTADGPLGEVSLHLAVQVEPTLRVVGERLAVSGDTLLSTALRDPARPTVQATWCTAGASAVAHAALPGDRLATALLPLRVSGSTEGQRKLLGAAEQLVVALRGVFPVAPRPELMRGPVRLGDGRLRSACDNLSAVLARTEGECSIRHGLLVKAMAEVCSGPVQGLTALPALMSGDSRQPLVEAVIAAVDRGSLGVVPVDRLGDGELRFLAMALVLLTGPGVLDVDTSTEHLPAGQVLTVVADGLDLGVDRRQARELLRLAGLAAARGHIRLLCTVQDPACAEGFDGVAVTVLGAGAGAGAVAGAGNGIARSATSSVRTAGKVAGADGGQAAEPVSFEEEKERTSAVCADDGVAGLPVVAESGQGGASRAERYADEDRLDFHDEGRGPAGPHIGGYGPTEPQIDGFGLVGPRVGGYFPAGPHAGGDGHDGFGPAETYAGGYGLVEPYADRFVSADPDAGDPMSIGPGERRNGCTCAREGGPGEDPWP